MDLFANLSLGFSTALSLSSLLHCFMGVLLGTLIGVLPGLGPLAAIAMLLPVTFALPPVESFIMLAGIYYGAQYGGSTTAILVNLPGESSSVMTAVEGYQMAKKGRAGSALAIAAIGSFFAGTVATLVIAMSAPLLARVALKFASPENFSLMVLGLIASVVLAVGSPLKALGMVVLGLLLGLAGTDVMSGSSRFTMGIPEMSDGINFVVVAMGIFGLGEVIRNLEQTQSGTVKIAKVGSLWPTPEELRRSSMPILRGTALGSFLGLLPGGGALLAAFASYAMEKKVSRRPGGIRPRRDRRRRGAGECQQRGGPDLLYSDVDTWHSVKPDHGVDDRRHDHPGHSAWACSDDGAAGVVLGPDSVDVGWQCFPDHPQSAADRHLDLFSQGAVRISLPGYPCILRHRRVYAVKCAIRCLYDGLVRCAWLRVSQARMRARAVAAGLYSWAA